MKIILGGWARLQPPGEAMRKQYFCKQTNLFRGSRQWHLLLKTLNLENTNSLWESTIPLVSCSRLVCPLWQVLRWGFGGNSRLGREQATCYFSSCFWPGLISKDKEQILWEVNLINAAKGRLQEIGIKIAKGAMSVGRSFPIQSPALCNSKGDRSRWLDQ